MDLSISYWVIKKPRWLRILSSIFTNITKSYIWIYVVHEKDKAIETDLSTDEAIKIIVSGGAILQM